MSAEELIKSHDPNHPANVICELCKLFYDWNWVTGTGGGMSIRDGDLVYLAPSGVHKERMKPENMFVMSLSTGKYLRTPDVYKPSACTPLFLAAFTKRGAGACIHTHSQAAVLVSLMFEKEFRISHIEQIKAIPKVTEPGNLDNFDTLVIPIIENTPHEDELAPYLEKTLEEYPQTSAVIVRRHGIFVWGKDVWKTKILNEAIDYLLELAVKMKQAGIDPNTGL
ncbi:methylthioribulose-1-phosphate dehydratase [Trichomonascus vanleenenianus]|uniref:methylthioribulose 1-phosphate dehydratase MDE1 n=1 Tax=Trichomonascus vanleenenianus TaxID=2268995 RepID=UPI003EC9AA64